MIKKKHNGHVKTLLTKLLENSRYYSEPAFCVDMCKKCERIEVNLIKHIFLKKWPNNQLINHIKLIHSLRIVYVLTGKQNRSVFYFFFSLYIYTAK
jgi:hypothetical protein